MPSNRLQIAVEGTGSGRRMRMGGHVVVFVGGKARKIVAPAIGDRPGQRVA